MASTTAAYQPHKGRVAIVTGASRGIGTAIARELAAKGAGILLNYTSNSSASQTKDLAIALAAAHGVKTAVIQADMGELDCGEKLIKAAIQEFGDAKSGDVTIHIIINNAGVAGNNNLGSIPMSEFDRQYRVNVRGPLLLMQAALPYLPTDRSGRIVNVSSVSAAIGYVGQSVYGGTKAALESMTRTWARELCTRATVNAINPGPVATDMWAGVDEEALRANSHFLANTPGAQVDEVRDGPEAVQQAKQLNGRPATSEEIAGIVSMLCAKESQYCTGSVVCANGGMIFSRGG